MIGNKLSTVISYGGVPQTTIETGRNTGESDSDFIDRHCRAILEWVRAHPADKLETLAPSVVTIRSSSQSDEAFVAQHDAGLQMAT